MLALSVLLLAFFFAPPETCSLSGTVVNSVTGAPLNKVDLRAESMDGKYSVAASTTTDANGNFTMVNLPAGQYWLKGIRNGYLDTYYGARRAASKGTTITLASGQEMKSLVIKLLPFGVIAGTVRDADGEPLSGATINLLRQRYDGPGHRKLEPYVQNVTTDDLGQYRIADLEPGKYYVEADPRDDLSLNDDHSVKSVEPRTVLTPALYPGVTDLAAARIVEVGQGARLTRIDISMVRGHVFNVRGHVMGGAGEQMYLNLYKLFYPGNGVGKVGLSLGAWSKGKTGDFEFRGVPQGSYTLRLNNYPTGIPVTVDHDMEDLRVSAADHAQIAAHVTAEGGDKALPAEMSLRYANGDSSFKPRITADLTFYADLNPDMYQVYLDSHLVIKSIRSEQTDVFQDGLTVSPGAKTSLEIVLAPEGAQVDGVVSDPDEKPVPGATVVLIAEAKLRSRSDSYYESTTDQYGRYHFENIRPGEYKLFAWDDPEPNAWFDPEFLKAFEEKGSPVAISPKALAVSNLHVLPVTK
jgi:uncharacterized surface anchored protein